MVNVKRAVSKWVSISLVMVLFLTVWGGASRVSAFTRQMQMRR
ncbi:hypothetical protein [Paenibacillus pectinilyticus]|nr:hypothetical protein [Paenibacillus pectinilyticus]